jgi:hypothetical protein
MIFIIIRIFAAGRMYERSIERLNTTAERIANLGDDLKELVRLKEREHDQLDKRITRLEKMRFRP